MQMQSNGEISPNPNSPLIKVEKNANGESAVSARELHKFLEVQTQFTIWCERMFEYGFTENQDYVAVNQKRLTAQGNETTFLDYALTLDCAKEIAMLQRSDKGKQARQYFIDCEKQLKNAPANSLQLFEVMLNQLKEQERLNLEQSKKLTVIEDKVNELQAHNSTHQTDYFTISGYYRYTGQKYSLSPSEGQKMGKALTSLSNALNFTIQKVSDMKFGTVGAYHIDIFKTYFEKKQVA